MAGTNLKTAVTSTLSIREADESGYALSAVCTGAPPTTAEVFQHGCIVTRTDSGTGTKALYENVGSVAVPSWNLMGDVTAGEITLATGSTLIGVAGVAAAIDLKGDGKILVGNGTTATSVAVSGDATLSNAGAVAVTKINSKTVSHVPMYAGKITWGGGGASKATTVTGVAATDIVVASIQTVPTEAAYLVSVAPTTDTITCVLSAANTTNDAIISYVVFRAA